MKSYVSTSPKLVVGLTGGIGSGKSTVAALFAARGVTVIDTDQLARLITQPDQQAFHAIVKKFGNQVVLANGQLDRNRLKKIVFAATDKRLWLEQLLHPLIRDEMHRQIASATSPYCIAVIPLLLETPPNPIINRVLVVDTSEVTQVSRTQTRDHLQPAEIDAIMRAQVNRATRIAAADDIIYNDGNLAELEPQVEKLHQLYLSSSSR